MTISRWCYWLFHLLRRRNKSLTIVINVIIFLSFYHFLRSSQKDTNRLISFTISVSRIKDIKVNPKAMSSNSEGLSKDMKIYYTVKKNNGWNKNINVITIFNSGSQPIFLGDKTLYFSNLKTILETSNEHFKVSHVDGSLYKIEPVSKSLIILPGQELSLEHKTKVYSTSRTDIMPNWYFVGPNNEVTLVENTAGEKLSFVANFTTKEQWKQDPGDKHDPYTPDQRYDIIGFDPPQDAPLPLVIPQPLQVMNLDRTNTMIIDKHWSLYAEKGLENEATYIKEYFQTSDLAIPSNGRQAKQIVLKTGDPQINMERGNEMESYALRVNTADQFVEIVGKTTAGLFYGVQTLISMADEKGAVPMVTIKDAPRFSYRGLQIDVARNFMPKDGILRLLDAMSKYKLNKFHFHLSDDEGWRLEIPGLPELTEIGSKRCHDPTGLKCLPVLHGADPTNTKRQFYTISDYQEILQYANQRNIEVIPELDAPAHCNAAIKSMEARYWKFKNQGNNAKAEEFLLTEFEDTSQYSSIQDYKHNTMNPCLESTYRFITHVIKTLKNAHERHQPLKLYHFGGDEIPKGAWKDSPVCLRVTGEGEYDTRRDKLKKHFVKCVGDIADSLGLVFGGWDDFFSEQEKIFPKRDVFVLSWNDLPALGGGKKAFQLAKIGYKVVLAHASHLYFDHPQEPDPEERGYFWATRFTDTRKTFGYIPSFCKTAGECNEVNADKNIYGITGCLWGETVRTVDQMDFMVFPRIISLAERAWHKAPWEGIRNDAESKKKINEEWKKFSSFIVRRELPRLEKLGIKYRIPPPGVRFDGKSIKVRTALPGLPVQFSKDGGESWHDVTKDTQIESRALVRTSSIDGRHKSRTIEIQPSK